MKKYLFVFSILASLATVACDTSSKASTTQQAIAVTPHAPEPVPATAIAIDTAISPMNAKKGFKKKMTTEMMQQAPMTPEEKQKMLSKPEEKALPKN
jgi:hypothetical protein